MDTQKKQALSPWEEKIDDLPDQNLKTLPVSNVANPASISTLPVKVDGIVSSPASTSATVPVVQPQKPEPINPISTQPVKEAQPVSNPAVAGQSLTATAKPVLGERPPVAVAPQIPLATPAVAPSQTVSLPASPSSTSQPPKGVQSDIAVSSVENNSNPVPLASLQSDISLTQKLASAVKSNIEASKKSSILQKENSNLSVQAVPVSMEPAKSKAKPSANLLILWQKLSLALIVIFCAVFFLALLVFLTEKGFFALGLEKYYGAIRLERLWGGLSSKSEDALAQSLQAISKKNDFKVSGSLDLTVSRSSDSDFLKPIISFSQIFLGIAPTKASFASVDEVSPQEESSIFDDTAFSEETEPADSTADSSSGTSNNSSTTSTGTNTESGSNSSSSINTNNGIISPAPSVSATGDSVSSTNTDLPASSSSVSTQSADEELSSPLLSTTKDINSKINGYFSRGGSELEINIDEMLRTGKINLKNEGKSLWLQSDSYKYDSKTKVGKWFKYDLEKLNENSLWGGFFSQDIFDGVSVKGKRVGSAKIDTARCFVYQIDSLEIGENLKKALGILEKPEKISGQVWIGTSDKLIRKLKLDIVPGGSSPVTAVGVDLSFSDYGVGVNFSQPDPSDITDAE